MRPAPLRGPVLIAALLAATIVPAQASAAQNLAQTQKSLSKLVRALPGNSSAYIREAASGKVLASRSASTKRIPASNTKLFTTSAALMLDGPTTRLATELRLSGTVDKNGVLDGDLIVKGAGNPSLTLDQVSILAGAARKAGVRQINGVLRADLGNWTSDQGTPLTSGNYNREIGGRIGSLVTLRGFASATVTDPARQVLVRLRDDMRTAGLKGAVKFGGSAPTPASATLLGQVNSPTIAQLAAATNQPSDNFYAEMLLRGVGARHGGAGTTTAGISAERKQFAKLGVYPTIADGSGLSRGTRVAPTTLVKLLDAMAKRKEGPYLRSSLALAGATGTLAGRMHGTAAAGRCRAKTGTLSNVSALSGWCTTVGKRTVTFSILMNNVSVASARSRQDAIAAAISRWSDRPAAPVVDPPDTTDDAGAKTPSKTTPSSTTPGSGGVTAGT